MKCKHDWEILDKTILPSPYEMVNEEFKARITEIRTYLFRKKVVLIISCKNCGKLEKIIESNPVN